MMKWIMVCILTVILNMHAYAESVVQDERTVSPTTWQELGIGVKNPGEINDWVYSGIKTPKEASLWIDALRSLGGVSYSAVAGIWKRNGFSADETKTWIEVGVKSPEAVRFWRNSGVKSAEELQQWQEVGVGDRREVEEWILHDVSSPKDAQKWIDIGVKRAYEVGEWQNIGIKTPTEVKKWKDIGVSSAFDASKWVQAGVRSIQEVRQWQNIGVKDGYTCQKWKEQAKASTPKEAKKWIADSLSPEEVADKKLQESMTPAGTGAHEVYSGQNNGVTGDRMTENYQNPSSDKWQGFLLIYFIIMIFTMFKGSGENRTIVIFRDYNDLGLTFLIPVSAFLIVMLFMSFGGNPKFGVWLALIVVLVLFGILVRRSYEDNGRSVLYTLLAVMTKVPLGFIWILNFITMLNPSGKTQAERRKNRGSAMVILAFLTPIIGMLVANKEGSLFNPKDWIKGRRVGNIRNHL